MLRGREVPEALEVGIDALFARFGEPGNPGVAVAVIKDGIPIHVRSYGYANLEHAIPLTNQSVLRLGSVSKHFCTSALLLLENRGSIRLDDPVRRYVPELPAYDPEPTLRHLATMTSGMADGLTLPLFAGLGPEHLISREAILEQQRRFATLPYSVGLERVYSNTNYALLSLVIERVSGVGFAAFMKQEIFDPLQMYATRVVEDGRVSIRGKAQGYEPMPDGSFRQGVFLVQTSGDGGIDTTIEDMIKWMQNFRADRHFGPNYRARLEANDPDLGPGADEYRLGITVSDAGGILRVGHAGGMPGYLADIAYYPSVDLGIVLLSNCMDREVLQLADKILDVVAPDARRPVAVPPTQARLMEGIYVCDSNGAVLQLTTSSGRFIAHLQGESFTLEPQEDGSFRSMKSGVGVRLQAIVASAGEPASVQITSGPLPPRHFQHCVPGTLRFAPADYTGCYGSEILGETHIVSEAADGLEVRLANPFRQLLWRRLIPCSPAVFIAPIEGEPSCTNVTLHFERGPDGRVVSFRCNINRAFGMQFMRRIGDSRSRT